MLEESVLLCSQARGATPTVCFNWLGHSFTKVWFSEFNGHGNIRPFGPRFFVANAHDFNSTYVTYHFLLIPDGWKHMAEQDELHPASITAFGQQAKDGFECSRFGPRYGIA